MVMKRVPGNVAGAFGIGMPFTAKSWRFCTHCPRVKKVLRYLQVNLHRAEVRSLLSSPSSHVSRSRPPGGVLSTMPSPQREYVQFVRQRALGLSLFASPPSHSSPSSTMPFPQPALALLCCEEELLSSALELLPVCGRRPQLVYGEGDSKHCPTPKKLPPMNGSSQLSRSRSLKHNPKSSPSTQQLPFSFSGAELALAAAASWEEEPPSSAALLFCPPPAVPPPPTLLISAASCELVSAPAEDEPSSIGPVKHPAARQRSFPPTMQKTSCGSSLASKLAARSRSPFSSQAKNGCPPNRASFCRRTQQVRLPCGFVPQVSISQAERLSRKLPFIFC